MGANQEGYIRGYQTADPIEYVLIKEHAKLQREFPTAAEKAMWQLLRKHFRSYKFRRQHIIGGYIADFICLSERLIIEVDGGYHNKPSQQERDRLRTEWIERQNMRVVRFANDEVLLHPHETIIKLREILTT